LGYVKSRLKHTYHKKNYVPPPPPIITELLYSPLEQQTNHPIMVFAGLIVEILYPKPNPASVSVIGIESSNDAQPIEMYSK